MFRSNTSTSLPPLCIYCKKQIQKNADNKKKNRVPVEHVIPKMLGVFGKDTMTLINTVCAACNKFFSKNLELFLGRDSVYGILYRSLSGILNESSLQHRRERIFFQVYSPEYGASLVNIHLNDKNLFEVRLAEQFALLNSTKGVKINYPKNELPRSETLEGLGLPVRPANVTFLGPYCTPAELSEKIREIKHILIRSGLKPKSDLATISKLPGLPQDSPLMFISKIDDTIMRTIAKIAFNYFVKHFKCHIAMSEHFDNIRNYILHGLRQDYSIVNLMHRSICDHVDNLSRKQFGHHIISVFQNGEQIIAEVILFNRDIFKVILSNNYPLYLRVFFSKHKFDIINTRFRSF